MQNRSRKIRELDPIRSLKEEKEAKKTKRKLNALYLYTEHHQKQTGKEEGTRLCHS